MEERSLASYLPGTTVWVKLTSFWWWPAEVIEVVTTEENVTRQLQVKTYGDDEGEDMHFVSSKMIKPYCCSERKGLIDKGRKKYQNRPSYRKSFDEAIKIANEKAGINDEESTEAKEESSKLPSPLSGNEFEIKRRKTYTPSHSGDYVENTSTPKPSQDEPLGSQSLVLNNSESICIESLSSTSERSLTPTRMSSTRSVKRPRTNSKRKEARETKKMKVVKQVGSNDSCVSTSIVNNGVSHVEVTPCNSSSESEDDLPAISMSQTPTKGYPSLKAIQTKDLVWVKHYKDPFWPALVMSGGNANKAVVKFFAYDGGNYPVKDKKKILPYLCAEKEQFEEKALSDPPLMEACKEALWLLRARGKEECGSTATEEYTAIKKRRSQVTPCKRLTLTNGSSSSSNDEPVESAFGYDITSTHDSTYVSREGEESPPKEVVSKFPIGSPYSYDILKENFLVLEPELHKIFKGEIISKNHRIFMEGTSKERNSVRIQNRCGPLLYLHMDHWNELKDTMLAWVKNWSMLENKEVHEMGYVSEVLFPEATILTIMKVERVDKEEAWRKFLAIDPND